MTAEAESTGDQYYGILAEACDAYIASADFSDLSVYENITKSGGGTALELACGTGRVLLPLLEAGYSVKGMDSSDEMLALCFSKGEALPQKQTPVYTNQNGNFELGAKFGTIFCAVASFTLIPTLEAMEQSLICIKTHLEKMELLQSIWIAPALNNRSLRAKSWRERPFSLIETSFIGAGWRLSVQSSLEQIVKSWPRN